MAGFIDLDVEGFDGSLYVDVELALYLRQRSVVNDLGCWIWQRALAGKGYAHIRRAKRDCYGHRLAFESLHGREPAEGLVADHRECDTPACVNPHHIVEATYSVNNWRTRTQTLVCLKGHRLDRFTPKGRRYCSICMKESNSKRRVAA